jgi:hypothetical protein
MKLENDLLTMFLKDKPFYKSNDCFCLGNSLTEAGDIAKCIIESNFKGDNSNNVGMAFE